MVNTNSKIKKISELASLLDSFRARGKKIVHCHGVFDLLHIGHIRYFEHARGMGDVLIVTLTPDRYVDKGPHRPAFTEVLRAEAIASLHCVDYVAINEWPTAEETLKLLRPDIYVKGSEFKDITSDPTGKIGKEEKVVHEIGATLAFTDDIVFSSTALINQYLSTFSGEVQEYLGLFRQRNPLGDVLHLLDEFSSLNVLVIGDTILDEYQYCDVIGKSSKDPVLALKYQSHDVFAGGVLAVANHAANFVNRVKLVSVLGERDSRENFIRSQLHPNISPFFVYQQNASTLIKRRFIEGYSLNKLFEIYIMDDSRLSSERNSEMCEWLRRNLPEYDLVIVSDFGHGAINEEMIKILTENAKFLAVNTQANAGNRGFNTVTRYPSADYICIAEHEIRLETRDLDGDIHPMMEALCKKLGCSRFVVTRGMTGALVMNENRYIVEVPSFTTKIVDRVGAGDAFFAITSLLAAQGASDEMIGFIGNAVGSLAVGIVGNKKSIDKQNIQKYITALLK